MNSRELKDGVGNSGAARLIRIYLLGIATVLGTQVSYWNEGLTHGIWPLVSSLLFVTTGYMCLTLCLCEMSAALPFSGGTYGLARVTLGQIPGYLMSTFEMIEYITYVMLTTFSLGELMTDVTGADQKFEPIYWVLFYLTGFIIQLSKPAVLWCIITILGVSLLIYVSVYIVAVPGAAHANFDRYATNPSTSTSSSSFLLNSFKCIPYTSWLFLGIETLPLASADVKRASKIIPRAILALLGTIIVTSFTVVFVASSINPGAISSDLQKTHSPLSYGYSTMLGISYSQATIFTIIIKYITGFGFMFAYGRQISAMQRSGLILSSAMKIWGEKNTLRRGLLLGWVCGIVTLGFTWRYDKTYFQHYHSACLLGNYLVCLGICFSYIQFRLKFNSLAKHFRSVLGIYGAMYGIVVFSIAFVSLAGFQNDNGMALFTLSWFVGYMVLRYLVFNMGAPLISKEEQSVMFVLYVINANTVRKRHIADQALARIAREGNNRHSEDAHESDEGVGSLTTRFKRTTAPLRASLNRYLRSSPRAASGGLNNSSSEDEDTSSGRVEQRRIAMGKRKKNGKCNVNTTTTGDSVTFFDQSDSDLGSKQSDSTMMVYESENNTQRMVITTLSAIPSILPDESHEIRDEDGENAITVNGHIARDCIVEEDEQDSQTVTPVLRRSYTSPAKLSPADSEVNTVQRLSGSKKCNDTFGSTKLSSQKFSASESSNMSGKNSRSGSMDVSTIEGFAASYSENELHRMTILDIIDCENIHYYDNMNAHKIVPEQATQLNSNSHHSKAAVRRSFGISEVPLGSIDETNVLSRQMSENLTVKPSPTTIIDQSLYRTTDAVTGEYLNSSSLKPAPVLQSDPSRMKNSMSMSSPSLSIVDSATPHNTDVLAISSAVPSTSRFNFRFFGKNKHKLSVPSAINTIHNNTVAAPQVVQGNSGKYAVEDKRNLDIGIMDMYSDEVEEFFMHSNNEPADNDGNGDGDASSGLR